MSHDERAIKQAMDTLGRNDPKLAVLIERHGFLNIKPRAGGFTDLAHIIIGQQLSDRAASTIQARVQALFPGNGIDIAPLASIDDDALRAAGLSAQKIGFIRGLADHISSGRLDLGRLDRVSDEEVLKELTAIRGVGRWTADMYLMFSLNRPDVLPLGDVALQSAMKALYGLDALDFVAQAQKIAEKWRPYRSLACRYLYLYLDSPREGKSG
jgi:DNA-3-methyladenine glycosylase II